MGPSIQMSTTYQPQSNGQTEALNKCFEMYLHSFTNDHHGNRVDLFQYGRKTGKTHHIRRVLK